MGSVSFTGNISSNQYLYLGGIAGELYPSNYDITVKNCANYGDAINSGVSGYSNIGGIVGYSFSSSSSNRVHIYNSLNYGTVTHSGRTSNGLSLGGIAGNTSYSTIENCVSAGKISSTVTIYIGIIVGFANSSTLITHCFWTSDVGYDSVSGGGSPNITDTSIISTLNITTMNELNEYAKGKDSSTWSRWVMLHLNGGTISNSVSQDTQIAGLAKSLPVPAKEGHTFDYWCSDSELTTEYTETSVMIDLYAKWTINQYTLTFNFGNGTVNNVVLEFNTTIEYPKDLMKKGYVFKGWNNSFP